jgi:ubiquinone/menaquinone biosynthesis C-methylase UbiE
MVVESKPQSDREGTRVTIEAVHDFWEGNVCGEHFISPSIERMTPEFFAAYRRFRYGKEHHLNEVIDWTSATDKSVLEIGLGLGADSTRWAQYAREFVGVDLTSAAVEATKLHLAARGLYGVVEIANAEALPFEDQRFDIVYSHGVLHHTPDTLKSLREVYRVARPGAQFIVMFYARNSFNYWIRIQGLMRLQLFWSLLKKRMGGAVVEPWKTHLAHLHARGWSYFGWSTWPHHCTDGPDCEIAFIRSFREMKRLLETAGFQIEWAEKAHFPIGAPRRLERVLARALGFYQFIWCRK